MSYKIKEAKDNWESLIRDVEKGEPQIIQRGGRDVAVIVSIEEWQRLRLKFADHLADKVGDSIKPRAKALGKANK